MGQGSLPENFWIPLTLLMLFISHQIQTQQGPDENLAKITILFSHTGLLSHSVIVTRVACHNIPSFSIFGRPNQNRELTKAEQDKVRGVDAMPFQQAWLVRDKLKQISDKTQRSYKDTSVDSLPREIMYKVRDDLVLSTCSCTSVFVCPGQIRVALAIGI